MRWLLLVGSLLVVSYHFWRHFHSTELYAIGTHFMVRSHYVEGEKGGELKQLSDSGFQLSRSFEQGEGAQTLGAFFVLCAAMAFIPLMQKTSAATSPTSHRPRWVRVLRLMTIFLAWVGLVVGLRIVSFPVHYRAVKEQTEATAAKILDLPAEEERSRRISNLFYSMWYVLEATGVLLCVGLAVWAAWPERSSRPLPAVPPDPVTGPKTVAEQVTPPNSPSGDLVGGENTVQQLERPGRIDHGGDGTTGQHGQTAK